MAGIITKRDAAAVERLVGKYGAPEVIKAVKAARPKGEPGHLPDHDLNALPMWVHVEYRRVKPDSRPLCNPNEASKTLSGELTKYGFSKPRSRSRIYALYREGAALREADAAAREWSDSLLNQLLAEFPPEKARRPFPVRLRRKPDGSFAGAIIDREKLPRKPDGSFATVNFQFIAPCWMTAWIN